jgi:hypothetical protein
VGWLAAIGIHLNAAASHAAVEWRRWHSAEVNRLTVSFRALVSTSLYSKSCNVLQISINSCLNSVPPFLELSGIDLLHIDGVF